MTIAKLNKTIKKLEKALGTFSKGSDEYKEIKKLLKKYRIEKELYLSSEESLAMEKYVLGIDEDELSDDEKSRKEII